MNRSHYGRKWLLKILCSDGTTLSIGNDGFSGLESLKCTFDINYPGYEGWYFSEFVIYNPTKETEKKIIQEGAEVYFYAGYQEKYGGKYGQIFGGKVFQSLFTRENVTDYKLTLMCMDGARLFKDNFAAFHLKDYSDQTLINETAARSSSPIPIGTVSSKIGMAKKPRGCVVFGSPVTAIREIVRNNAAQMFMINDTLNILKATDSPSGEAIVVDTNSGLIGTPQQIDFGISFRTLLNPELILTNPPKWVKLDLSAINVKQQKAVPGQNIVPILPKDGYFKIGGVRHSGDTRGNDWYTDVMGYSLTGKAGLQLTVPEMLSDPTVNPN
jgi:hypothetical protein